MKSVINRLNLWLAKSYARGKVMPILVSILICLSVFLLFVILDAVFAINLSLGRLVELMIDPGAFSKESTPATMFQFIVMLSGTIFFTALFITTISNIFSNISRNYLDGEISLICKGHILIIGVNETFYNSLNYFCGLKGRKVVLTPQPAAVVRAKIGARIGKSMADHFLIISGEIQLESSLERASFGHASRIYIFGEEKMENHDSVCVSILRKLNRRDAAAKGGMPMYYIEIDNISTFRLIRDIRKDELTNTIVFNPDKEIVDKLFLSLEEDCLNLEFTGKDDPRHHHLIVIGDNQMAECVSNYYALISHFPNFTWLNKRSKLTIIDNDDNFSFASRSNIEKLADITTITCEGRVHSAPSVGYEGFIDMDFVHVVGSIRDRHVKNYLEEVCHIPDEIVNIVVCSDRPDHDLDIALSMQHRVYEMNLPVFLYQPIGERVISSTHLSDYYDNIRFFGNRFSLGDLDTENRRLMRCAIYVSLYSTDFAMAWQDFPDYKTVERLVNGLNMTYRLDIEEEIPYLLYYSKHLMNIQGCERAEMVRTLHYRWILSRLIDGYDVLPEEMNEIGITERDAEQSYRKNKYRKNKYLCMDSLEYLDNLSLEFYERYLYGTVGVYCGWKRGRIINN